MNTYECAYCGEQFKRYPSKVTTEEPCCSPSCATKLQVEEMNIEDHNFYDGGSVSVECENCGKQLERRPCKLERSEKFFCGKECESEWKTGKRTGKDHPNWKGGVRISYGPNWHKQRNKRIEMDGDMCVVCKRPNSVEKEKTGSSLTVHHIQPIRSYMVDGEIDYERANRLDNLVTLCGACHRRWEGIPLRPEVDE